MKFRPALLIISLAILGSLFFGSPYTALAVEGAEQTVAEQSSWNPLSGLVNFGVDVLLGLFGRIVAIFIWIFSWVLWLAGLIFDTAVNFSITEGAFRSENVALINIGWPVVRDVANLGIVLALLVISIATMLRLDSYEYKKTLPRLILVALLISFSLPIGQFIIDASNVFSVGIYNNITDAVRTDVGATQATSVFGVKLNTTKDISSVFARGLSITEVHTFDSTGSVQESAGQLASGSLAILISGIMGVVILLVTSFVFFAFAMLFITRTVVLWLVLIFSPLAFAGMIFPATAGYAKQWWDTLFKQAFFAPAALFLIWLVAKFLEAGFVGSAVTHSASQTFLNGFAKNGQLMMQYIVLIFLLWQSLVLAQKFGSVGAEVAVKTGSKWAGSARDATKKAASRGRDRALGGTIDRAIGSTGAVGRVSRALIGNRVSSGLGLTRAALDRSAKGKEAREYTATREAETLKNLAPREQARALRAMSGAGALRAFEKMSDDDRTKVTKEVHKAGAFEEFGQTLRVAATKDPRSKGANGQLDPSIVLNDTMENYARAGLPHVADAEVALKMMRPDLFENGTPVFDPSDPSHDPVKAKEASGAVAKLMNKMKSDQRADVYQKNGTQDTNTGKFIREHFKQNGSINDITKSPETLTAGHQMLQKIATESRVDMPTVQANATRIATQRVAADNRKNNTRFAVTPEDVDKEMRKQLAAEFRGKGIRNIAEQMSGNMSQVLLDPNAVSVRNPS